MMEDTVCVCGWLWFFLHYIFIDGILLINSYIFIQYKAENLNHKAYCTMKIAEKVVGVGLVASSIIIFFYYTAWVFVVVSDCCI
jgi:hypothetical protein